MVKPFKLYHLLAIFSLLGVAACKKDRINCIEVTALGFGHYCENTYLMQAPANHGILGKTIKFDGQTYRHVIKIAAGNLTLYDGLRAGDRIFVKLRKYDPQADHELIVSPYPCPAILGPEFPDVPIYVATAISEECP